MIVSTPKVRAISGTEIGFVSLRFMYPFPVKVPTEINVQGPQTAALLPIPDGQEDKRKIKKKCSY